MDTEDPLAVPNSRWHFTLLTASILTLICAISWFIIEQSFEAIIAIFLAILGIIAYIKNVNIKLDIILSITLIIAALICIYFVVFKPKETSTHKDLYIFSAGQYENSYIIEGSDIHEFEVGESLVVYDEVIRDTEIASAILRVTSKNPDTLTAQVVLSEPGFVIHADLRVDDQIYNASSKMIPAFPSAVGMYLDSDRILIHNKANISEGTVLQALEPQISGSVILDFLPFDPPIQMRISQIGYYTEIARVELIKGAWPKSGTFVSVVKQTNEGFVINSTPTPLHDVSMVTDATPITTQSSDSNLESFSFSSEDEILSTPNLEIIIIIDASGSMLSLSNEIDPEGKRFEAVEQFIENLTQNDSFADIRVAIIFFASEAIVVDDFVSIKNDFDRTRLINNMREAYPKVGAPDSTNTLKAFQAANNLLQDSHESEYNPMIVIITDGIPYSQTKLEREYFDEISSYVAHSFSDLRLEADDCNPGSYYIPIYPIVIQPDNFWHHGIRDIYSELAENTNAKHFDVSYNGYENDSLNQEIQLALSGAIQDLIQTCDSFEN